MIARCVRYVSNISQQIQSFSELPVDKKGTMNLAAYAEQLLLHEGTSPFLRELIDFSVSEMKSPIVLKSPSVVKSFFEGALKAMNMNDLDMAFHFMWHSMKYNEIPFNSAFNTIIMMTPQGTDSNIEKWQRLIGEMMFYALPDNVSASHLEAFYKRHSSLSSSFPALIKSSLIVTSKEDLKKIFYFSQNRLRKISNELETTIEDYTHGKNLILFEIDKRGSVYLHETFLNLLVTQAGFHKDSEFISQMYDSFHLFSKDKRPHCLYSELIYVISQVDMEGEKSPVIKQLIDQCYEETSAIMLYTESLFDRPRSLEAVVKAYIDDQDIYQAAHFMHSADMLELPIPEHLILTITELALEKQDVYALFLMTIVADTRIESFDVNRAAVQLRSQGIKFPKYDSEIEQHPLIQPYFQHRRARTSD